MKSNSRKPCVIGNWKMHGSKSTILQWVNTVAEEKLHDYLDCIICPPSVYLQTFSEALKEKKLSGFIKLGAQNVYYEDKGAFTGEISVSMLKELGCQYVILGHSERRQIFAESHEWIARKFVAAYDAGLKPIVCVGETLEERSQGKATEVVTRQLDALLNRANINQLANSIIAYEPIWAIGTGQTATPEDAETMHSAIRQWFAQRLNGLDKNGQDNANSVNNVRIIYGGSVKPSNATQLFHQPNIDGVLVGAASLVAEDFLAICSAAVSNEL